MVDIPKGKNDIQFNNPIQNWHYLFLHQSNIISSLYQKHQKLVKQGLFSVLSGDLIF